MAEFCVKCFEKMNDLKPRSTYTYRLGSDFCEGCREWRNDIVYGLDAGPVLQLIQYVKLKKQG